MGPGYGVGSGAGAFGLGWPVSAALLGASNVTQHLSKVVCLGSKELSVWVPKSSGLQRAICWGSKELMASVCFVS